MRPPFTPVRSWKIALGAACAAGLLLTGCSKPGGKSSIDKSMDEAGVYGGRNSPNASNTGGADGAGGAPVGTSAPNSENKAEGANRSGPF